MKKFTLACMAMLCIATHSYSQVSIGGTPYTTLKAAFDAINAGTHTGAVAIDISGNTTETASAVLNASGSGSASYTSVVIQPTASNVSVSGNIAGALVTLNGADNVTIDGRVGTTDVSQLTFRNTNTASLSAVIRMASTGTGAGATNNTVKWCTIQAGINTVSLSVFGIYIAGTTISATGTGADNDNISITNNTIKKASFGIYCRGTSAANQNDGITIQNNTIGADVAADYITLNGVDMTNSTNINISGNRIYNIIADHTVQLRGLFLGAAISNATIDANQIYNIQNTTTANFRGGQGIFIVGTATANTTISNNAIWGLQGHGSGTAVNNVWGILVSSGGGFNLYYNTISLTATPPATGSTDRSGCIHFASSASTAIQMVNNNLYNTRLPGNATLGFSYCVFSLATAANITESNYNNYYVSGSRVNVGQIGGTERAALSDWQTGTSKDANSISANPLLANANGNMRVGTASPCLNAGTDITGITTDNAGATRNASTPTIGAFEAPLDLNDASVNIVYTLGTIAVGYTSGHVITATVTNNGNITQTNLNVTLAISGANTFNNVQVIPSLDPGVTETVSFAGFSPSTIGSNTVTVSVPADAINTNNSISLPQVVTINSLAYSVGPVAAGGVGFNGATGDFVAKFNSATNALLNQCVVNFFTGGQPFQLLVLDASGANGTPGTVLYTSSSYTSATGAYTVVVDPPINIPGGDFFIGVKQTGTTNVSFAFQTENPIRSQSFYYTSPTGGTTWTDFAPGAPFRFMIEPRFALANDVAATPVTLTGAHYYYPGTTAIDMAGDFLNLGVNTATFNVTRKIRRVSDNVEVYSDTKPLTNVASNAPATATFAPFTTFVSGVQYRIKDSAYLGSDQNRNNDTASALFQPNVAKQNLICYADAPSRDSLMAHFALVGLTNYDVLPNTYTGTFRPWRTVFYLCLSAGSWTAVNRDSLKAFIDDSSPADKKSLAIFGNDLAYLNDPIRNTTAPPADTVFLRQYLRGRYIGDNWLTSMAASAGKFKGVHPSFVNINADSVNGSFPDFVLPVNGGEAAFTPMSESGNADTTNAVLYSSANGNIFYGTNVYANYITKHHPFVPFLNIYNFVNEANLPLPAGISNVRAFQKQNAVQVEWSNRTENNVSHYEVEKSATASGFIKAARVNAKGGISNNYAWLDVAPAAGNNYYRIKIFNKDGSFTYSPVVNVRIGGRTDIAVYPNPVKENNFNIQFTSVEKGRYRINMYSQAGQIMATTAYEHQGGSATCNIALKQGIPAGVYVVVISNGTVNITKSLVIE